MPASKNDREIAKAIFAAARVINLMDADLCELGKGRNLSAVEGFEGWHFPDQLQAIAREFGYTEAELVGYNPDLAGPPY